MTSTSCVEVTIPENSFIKEVITDANGCDLKIWECNIGFYRLNDQCLSK